MDESVRRYLSEPKRRAGRVRSVAKTMGSRDKGAHLRKREHLKMEREIWRRLGLKTIKPS